MRFYNKHLIQVLRGDLLCDADTQHTVVFFCVAFIAILKLLVAEFFFTDKE